MEIKQSKKYKELKTALQQTPAELKPEQLRTFAMKLKMSAITFAENLAKTNDPNQALMELQGIQQITQQLIASINSGTRKTMVTPTQMMQQTRDVAKMEAPQTVQAPVAQQ